MLSRDPRLGASATSGPCITTFVFNVRNLPAALYKAMGGFATNGVNMTKLESYMVGGYFFATQFYADVEGHPDEPPLRRALEELAFFSTEMRILGVYSGSFRPARQDACRGVIPPGRRQATAAPLRRPAVPFESRVDRCRRADRRRNRSGRRPRSRSPAWVRARPRTGPGHT